MVSGLRTFLMVHQDRPRGEVWRRDGDNWAMRSFGPDDTIALPKLDGSLAVGDVYGRVVF